MQHVSTVFVGASKLQAVPQGTVLFVAQVQVIQSSATAGAASQRKAAAARMRDLCFIAFSGFRGLFMTEALLLFGLLVGALFFQSKRMSKPGEPAHRTPVKDRKAACGRGPLRRRRAMSSNVHSTHHSTILLK